MIMRPKAQTVGRDIVKAALDQARTRVRDHLKTQRYQAALGVSVQLNTTFGPLARQVGLSDELLAFQGSCEVFARLAERAGKTDPP